MTTVTVCVVCHPSLLTSQSVSVKLSLKTWKMIVLKEKLFGSYVIDDWIFDDGLEDWHLKRWLRHSKISFVTDIQKKRSIHKH